MRILVFVHYYLPGFKSGGPTRSIANLVDSLGDQHEFYVVTSDRDLGDGEPYPEARVRQWQSVGKAKVKYFPTSPTLAADYCRTIDELRPDVLYVNSFFNPYFAAIPLMVARWKFKRRVPTIVAPRGEFDRGALSLKPTKKAFFIKMMKALGVDDGLVWQATCEEERLAIQREMGFTARVRLVPNLTTSNSCRSERSIPKRAGSARLAFFSRIAVKKNLLTALKILGNQRGQVSLDILGPIEDAAYWRDCQRLIHQLPDNIKVTYRGAVPPTEIGGVLSQYDAMFLPTLGENFGHAISESLTAGCPVLISDRTPWRNLQSRGVGWDLSLESPAAFGKVIDELVAMTDVEHRSMRDRAVRFALQTKEQSGAVTATEQMFLEAAIPRSQAA